MWLLVGIVAVIYGLSMLVVVLHFHYERRQLERSKQADHPRSVRRVL